MRPTFDMDALRTMVVGTELGSFARAASQLGRSQSAVSMQLRRLEQQAGKPLFRRSGRGLAPTEAGEALLAYARRIISLHDEAAISLGASTEVPSVRMGLPQDFFDDIMPDAITQFSRQRPRAHVEVRAGRNHALEEDIRAGRLDLALAFYLPGSGAVGSRVASLPMLWLGTHRFARPLPEEPIALVLYDHPCLFRQAALQTLERKRWKWRLALTTPSLPGIWAALRSGYGVSIRTSYRIPAGIRNVGPEFGLPSLPPMELRILTASNISPAASRLRDILEQVTQRQLSRRTSGPRP